MRKQTRKMPMNHKNKGPVRPLKYNAIYDPNFIPTDVPDTYPEFVNSSLRIAVLLSESLLQDLKYECRLLDLYKLHLNKVLYEYAPHFLLVESTAIEHPKLANILHDFNARNIPTVLWITTPLSDMERYYPLFSQFTLVFTACQRDVAILQRFIPYNPVYYLPLAAQPRVSNPITVAEKKGFAAYLPFVINPYDKHAKNIRQFHLAAAKHYSADLISQPKDLSGLLQTLKQYSVVLYDPIYKPTVDYSKALLYQLIACGVNVIALHQPELQQTFGDHVLFTQSHQQTQQYLQALRKDPELLYRRSLLGQRFVFGNNTYTHRIETILELLGYHHLKPSPAGASIVCCTHMDCYMNSIFDNYLRQTYELKELIIILNDPLMDKSIWEEKAKSYSNVRILQPVPKKTVGHCMNLAVENAAYEYIVNFDHDDYYGPEYVGDSLNVFRYTDAGLIGKKTHYVYYEGSKTLDLMLPNFDNRYVVNVDGSSIVFKKSIFEKVQFIDQLFADVQFSLDCWNNDIKVYSCDKFNHVYFRRESKEQHAFKMSDQELKRFTYTVVDNTDFTPYVNV